MEPYLGRHSLEVGTLRHADGARGVCVRQLDAVPSRLVLTCWSSQRTHTWSHLVTLGPTGPSPGVDGQKGLRLEFNSRH
eukprot:1177367-Prorocentrum_minimum.AAC.3